MVEGAMVAKEFAPIERVIKKNVPCSYKEYECGACGRIYSAFSNKVFNPDYKEELIVQICCRCLSSSRHSKWHIISIVQKQNSNISSKRVKIQTLDLLTLYRGQAYFLS